MTNAGQAFIQVVLLHPDAFMQNYKRPGEYCDSGTSGYLRLPEHCSQLALS